MRQRPVLMRHRSFAFLILLFGCVAFFAITASATAQPSPPSAFGSPAATQPKSAGGLFDWVLRTQQDLQRGLAESVRRLKEENVFGAALMLALLSFLYGVVHAIGPGHGKAIISSYVVANDETVRRGIIISFIAAGLQALTAIALVGILAIALNATGLEINAWSNQLETVSYALIALVGLWLLVSQLTRLFQRWRAHHKPASLSAASVTQHHHHDHDHGHDHHHHHGHSHGDGECCSHMVEPSAVAGPFSWRKTLAVVLSVGVRPCTGAILVLVFAFAQGLFWAGVAATFAMALGTAITVAALATLALGSRELALRLGGGSGAWAEAIWAICSIGGSALILLLGATLFFASLGPARPF